MFKLDDVAYVRNKLNEKTAKVNSTLAGALGGAGIGLLTQAMRPKDRDQNKLKEYILSAILGAGLGAAGGFAYNSLSGGKKHKSHKVSDDKKKDGKPGEGETVKKVKPLPEYDRRDSSDSARAAEERRKHNEEALKKYVDSGRDPKARTAAYGIAQIDPELAAAIERKVAGKRKSDGVPFKAIFSTLDQIERDNLDIFDNKGRPMPGRGIILSRENFDKMYPGTNATDREIRRALEPYVWDGVEGIRPTPLWWSITDGGSEEIWPTHVTKDGYVVPLDMTFKGKRLEPLYRSAFNDTGSTFNRIADATVETARDAANYVGLSDWWKEFNQPLK